MTDTVTTQPPGVRVQLPAGDGRHGRRGPILIAVSGLAALSLPAVVDTYTISVASTAVVMAVLALSTQLLTGIAGLPSLGQTAYLGVGAYTAADLARAGLTLGPVLLAAAALAGAAAAAVTAPLALRARGTTFLMVTFALGQLAYITAGHATVLTGGDEGLSVPPVVAWPGMTGLRAEGYLYLYLLVCLLALCAVTALLLRSRFGLILRGIADHEPRMAALGHRVSLELFAGYVAAGALAGAGGALLVAAHRYLSPDDLGFDVAALALLAAAIGAGSMLGAIAGAVLVVAVRDLAGDTTSGHATALLGLAFIVVAYRPTVTGWLRARSALRRRA
jgi:branched-chain amino acid transport system permease protein